MASIAVSILDAIRDAIKANHTLVSGTYDLSGADQVKIGRMAHPPGSSAFVAVAPPSISAQPDARTLQNCAMAAVFDVQGWTPTTADDTEIRANAALNLISDIQAAVTASRRDAGGALKAINGIRNISYEWMPIDGDEGDLAPGFAACFGTITVEYSLLRGV